MGTKSQAAASAAGKPAGAQAEPSLTDMLNSIKTPGTGAAAAPPTTQAAPSSAAPAADTSAQPSLTDMLNSIKTPGTEAPAAPTKPEKPAGGLGASTLARVATKKTGIHLGGTGTASSTSLNRIEAISEPAIEIKPIPPAEPEAAEVAPAPVEEPAFVESLAEETIVEPVSEPVSETIAEPVTAAVDESVLEAVTDTIVEQKLEPVAETIVETYTEAVPEAVVEQTEAPVDSISSEPLADESVSAEAYADAVSEAIAGASAQSSTTKESFTPDVSSASSDFTSFKPSFDAPSFESYESSTEEAMMNFAADREEPVEQPTNTLFESAAVDKEIEDIFSNLVPPEAQQEVNEATLSHNRLPAIDKLQAQSLLAEEAATASPLKPATPPVTPPPVVAKAPEPVRQEPVKAAAPEVTSESNTLFETEAVDREIEDIFSNLVPPEAQQEVNEATLSHNRLQAMDRSEAKALLGRDEEKQAAKVADMNAGAKKAEQAPVSKAPEPALEKAPENAVTIAPEVAEKKEGLFDPSLDKEIDDIFLNLAPEEAQAEVTNETLAKVKSPEITSEEMSFAPPGSEAEKIEPAVEKSKAESVPVEKSAAVEPAKAEPAKDEAPIEAKPKVEESFAPPAKAAETPTASTADKVADLLDSLTETSASEADAISKTADVDLASAESALEKVTTFVAEHAAAEEAVKAASDTASVDSTQAELAATDAAKTAAVNKPKEVKEFGRLSAKSATAGTANETVGTMKTIGKLLIDVPAIENIIKTGESGTIGKNLATARVISSQRGESINALLEKIDQFPGIAGTLIVGHDGLVISSTLKAGKDKDTIGALSVACLGSTNLGTRKLEIGKLKQMVFITDSTITVLTDVEVGILAVLLDNLEIDKIDGVLQTIHDTIHG